MTFGEQAPDAPRLGGGGGGVGGLALGRRGGDDLGDAGLAALAGGAEQGAGGPPLVGREHLPILLEEPGGGHAGVAFRVARRVRRGWWSKSRPRWTRISASRSRSRLAAVLASVASPRIACSSATSRISSGSRAIWMDAGVRNGADCKRTLWVRQEYFNDL